ncbi:ATP-dependent RNA helicase DDX51-like [Amphibalanus amphitrite]|uniref:ATP-dependent RNA helicase DDX51-like n=1 Tax=Amphibalanus amphitrite TaxID=1232801 RepID=UPI001C91C811|nr:ATP-dependent RNA helicase DDX51-like [Amphibalanus amphitrite]
MALEDNDDVSERLKQEAEILQRLNARKGRRSLQDVSAKSPAAAKQRTKEPVSAAKAVVKPPSPDTADEAESSASDAEMADLAERTAAAAVASDDDSEGGSDSDGDAAAATTDDFTVLDEVERSGRRTVHRVLPDWLAHPQPIGDRRPALAELPALCPELRARLAAEGIERLFPVQAAVLPELLAAAESPLPPADLCVSAPTGSGKTLAFVLPLVQALRGAVVRRVRALAVLPTQALAAQVAAVFRQYAADTPLCVRLLGGDTVARERRKLVAAGPRGPLSLADIVVSTPGRLMDHINSTEGFSLAHLRYLVIDEADRVIEMAETGWLKAVERAAAAADGPPRRAAGPLTAAAVCAPHLPLQKLLFSATLSQNPEKLERLSLFQPRLMVAGTAAAAALPGQFVGKFTTPAELSESFSVVAPQLKPLLLHHLLRQPDWERALVFVNSNEAAHRLALLLSALGARVAEFSGAVPAGRRRRALAELAAGRLAALVCSDAMARGMDVDAVDAVVSYDIPALVKTYVHRVGRTARAGRPGQAVTLLLERQRGHFQRLMAQAGKADGQVRETPAPLDELRQYEATYVAALEQVQTTVETEREEAAAKLRGRPAGDAQKRKSDEDRAAKKKKKRVRKRKPSAAKMETE